jgi:hypothetical protein
VSNGRCQACHILAFEFLELEQASGFDAVGLQRPGETYFDHVYASNGTVDFDPCGWTAEAELIAEILAFERVATPIRLGGVVIPAGLDELCAGTTHREPGAFAADPRPRARRYLQRYL